MAKSAKPIPVLILSFIWGGRSYTKKKCTSVFVIVIGFIVFMYKEGGVDKKYEDEIYGKVLVGLSLLCDGFSGATQVISVKLFSFLNFQPKSILGTN